MSRFVLSNRWPLTSTLELLSLKALQFAILNMSLNFWHFINNLVIDQKKLTDFPIQHS